MVRASHNMLVYQYTITSYLSNIKVLEAPLFIKVHRSLCHDGHSIGFNFLSICDAIQLVILVDMDQWKIS